MSLEYPGGNGVWRVKVTAEEDLTLTVRVEDAWLELPPSARSFLYSASVKWLPSGKERTLASVAPDARIFLDVPAKGAVELVFTPLGGIS